MLAMFSRPYTHTFYATTRDNARAALLLERTRVLSISRVCVSDAAKPPPVAKAFHIPTYAGAEGAHKTWASRRDCTKIHPLHLHAFPPASGRWFCKYGAPASGARSEHEEHLYSNHNHNRKNQHFMALSQTLLLSPLGAPASCPKNLERPSERAHHTHTECVISPHIRVQCVCARVCLCGVFTVEHVI